MKETNIETNRQAQIIIMLNDQIEREIDIDIHLQTWARARKKNNPKEAVLEEETNGQKDNQKNSSSELYFLMCC